MQLEVIGINDSPWGARRTHKKWIPRTGSGTGPGTGPGTSPGTSPGTGPGDWGFCFRLLAVCWDRSRDRCQADPFCKRVQDVESNRARLGPAWIGSQVPVPAGDRSRATSGGPVSGRPRERRQLEVTWAQAGPSGN